MRWMAACVSKFFDLLYIATEPIIFIYKKLLVALKWVAIATLIICAAIATYYAVMSFDLRGFLACMAAIYVVYILMKIFKLS